MEDASRASALWNYFGETWRSVAEDGIAISIWIGRKTWKRKAVDVVDCAGGCGWNFEKSDYRCCDLWSSERSRAGAGHECGVHERVGEYTASPGDIFRAS